MTACVDSDNHQISAPDLEAAQTSAAAGPHAAQALNDPGPLAEAQRAGAARSSVAVAVLLTARAVLRLVLWATRQLHQAGVEPSQPCVLSAARTASARRGPVAVRKGVAVEVRGREASQAAVRLAAEAHEVHPRVECPQEVRQVSSPLEALWAPPPPLQVVV